MGKVVLVFDSNPLQLLWIQSPANYVNTIVRNACLMSAGNPQPTTQSGISCRNTRQIYKH